MKFSVLNFAGGLAMATGLFAQSLDVTSTGINGTAIGATTPSTGAFTTVSAAATGNVLSDVAQNALTVSGPNYGGGIALKDTKYAGFYADTAGSNLNVYTNVTSGSGASSGLRAVFEPTSLVVYGMLNAIYPGSTHVAGAFKNDDKDYHTIQVWNAYSGAGTRYFVQFYTAAGSGVGSISSDGTNTSYNTSSDQRLKTAITDFKESGRLIDALRVRSWKWKSSGEMGLGFIAQEENAADPVFAKIGAVTVGDDDPDKITRQWQRSDQALVPILVAELQALRARVAASEVALAELKREQGNSHAAVAKLNSP